MARRGGLRLLARAAWCLALSGGAGAPAGARPGAAAEAEECVPPDAREPDDEELGMLRNSLLQEASTLAGLPARGAAAVPPGASLLGAAPAEEARPGEPALAAPQRGGAAWTHTRRVLSSRPLPAPLLQREFAPLDAQEPFVVVASNETVVTVKIADPAAIASVYALMFVPLAVVWAAALGYGAQGKLYGVLATLTYFTMLIGMDLVNQSLSVLMGAPMSITAIQALSMSVIAGIWSLVSQLCHPCVTQDVVGALWRWTPVAILFCMYSLASHLVSMYCSLSERTVFSSLIPVAVFMSEVTFLPQDIKTHATFNSKVAMLGMVLGALLFGLQYPAFTAAGLASAWSMVATKVPLRLFQRWNLAECMQAPLALLACYDGVVLFVASWTSSVITETSGLDTFWATWRGWVTDPSIAIMLAMSLITFTGCHVAGLALLRVTSATSVIIFANVANILTVIMGVCFFGDDLQSPLTCLGMAMTLSCGLWYALDLCRALRKSDSPQFGEPPGQGKIGG